MGVRGIYCIFLFHSINFFAIGINITSCSGGYVTVLPPNCFLNRVTPAHEPELAEPVLSSVEALARFMAAPVPVLMGGSMPKRS